MDGLRHMDSIDGIENRHCGSISVNREEIMSSSLSRWNRVVLLAAVWCLTNLLHMNSDGAGVSSLPCFTAIVMAEIVHIATTPAWQLSAYLTAVMILYHRSYTVQRGALAALVRAEISQTTAV